MISLVAAFRALRKVENADSSPDTSIWQVVSSTTRQIDNPSALQPVSSTTVSLTNVTGVPHNLASGILFGVPDNGSQRPQDVYSGYSLNFAHGGGPSLRSPRRV